MTSAHPVTIISAQQTPPRPLASFLGPYRLLWTHAFPTVQMTRREVAARYRGSIAGVFWSFAQPLLMLGIYTFLFGVLFRPRVETGAAVDTWSFAENLFVGLILHAALAECATRAPGLILGNPNYVKKFVFPLELLTWPVVFGAIVQAGFGVLVLLFYRLASGHELHWTALLLPLILAPFALLLSGLIWLLSAVGVFIRDISQVMGLVVSVLMFLSPILYAPQVLPDGVRTYLMLNPLTLPVLEARKLLLSGELPDWGALGIYTVVAALVAWAGFHVFSRLKRAFADVI